MAVSASQSHDLQSGDFQPGNFQSSGFPPSDGHPYEYYAALHDPDWYEDQRPAPSAKRAKKSRPQQIRELTDEAEGLEAGFITTYQPARYEGPFLLEAIRPFYDLALIVDVLANVKGGKEANVYRCRAEPSLGVEYLAAKVYRPRKFRNLRNDKMYREGRQLLLASGREVKANERRIVQAVQKKTEFGIQIAHSSWLMYEYTTLEKLRAVGAHVPRPFAVSDNAILMQYVGDGGRAAPTLHESRLDAAEARRLFDLALEDVERMLQIGVVHGDLSAYNILYWQGEITLIDFPQVTDIYANSHARHILQRDLQRLCDYFAGYGVRYNADDLAADLWRRYRPTSETDIIADLSRLEEMEVEE